jgi:hypothetical protein
MQLFARQKNYIPSRYCARAVHSGCYAAVGIWRKLIQAMNADNTGRIARRVKKMAEILGKRDPRARAFAKLLHSLSRMSKDAAAP